MAFKTKEAARAYHKKWSKANSAKRKASQKKYKDAHPQVLRGRRLKVRYGLEPGDYEKLATEQSGRCAVCRRLPADTNRGILVVDHDHETDKVRELLCNDCNVAVASVHEDLATAIALVSYLVKHGKVGTCE